MPTAITRIVQMVKPDEPLTRNKIRDAKICRMYATDGMTMEQISKYFGVSPMRISAILKRNSHLLKWDQNLEKAKRLNRLERELRLRPEGQLSRRKDVLDILEAQRKEIDGETKNTVNIVNQNSVTINNFSSLIEKFHADKLQA